MSFLSDLVEGNFGNLGHDITSDPAAEAGLAGAAILGTGGLLAPEIFAGFGAGLGAEAAGAGIAGAAGGVEAGTGALGAAGSGLAGLGADIGSDFLAPSGAGLTAGTGNLSDLGISGAGFSEGATSPVGGFQGQAIGDIAGVPGAGGAPAVTPGASTLDSLNIGGAGTGITEAAGGTGVSGSAGTNILNTLGSSITNQVTKNPVGIAAAGGGLALNLFKANQSPSPALDQERSLAAGAEAQARQMTSYLASGTLPPGLQTAVDQAVAAQKARIVANHAAQGQPTDPTQNSALAQELSSIDLQATAQIAQIATQLYTQGVNMLQIDAGLLDKIYQADVAQNQQVSGALTNFAKALAPSTNMNLVKVA